MILVTHEMKFARDVSSEVIYLHKGLIEEQGPPSQVFGSPRAKGAVSLSLPFIRDLGGCIRICLVETKAGSEGAAATTGRRP